jgi:hypothetical protein
MCPRLIVLTAAFALSAASAAFSQSNPSDPSNPSINTNSSGSVTQPQGKTGPINTGSGGGAPASSPQGETPPGMQSAPKGSDKTIRADPNREDVPAGTAKD